MSIDYNMPLATLLREGTRLAHDTVAMSPGAKLLLGGELDKEEYIRYIMMLWHVYDAFESALDRHAAHPTLEPTYNPTLLARAPTLAADISYLLQVQESTWQSHPAHLSLLASMPSALTAYVARINELANATDPSPLLAHSYVRYLGDLSGGQAIRHTLAKAYNLDEEEGDGIAFYAFKELRSSKLASQGEMKRIKEWFRDGMDAGGRTVTVKETVVKEASAAFDLNTALFASIALKVNDKKITKESHLCPVQTKEKGFQLSQVISVIVAVCLSHFVLVTLGYTGTAGYEKFVAFEQWFTTFWKSTDV